MSLELFQKMLGERRDDAEADSGGGFYFDASYYNGYADSMHATALLAILELIKNLLRGQALEHSKKLQQLHPFDPSLEYRWSLRGVLEVTLAEIQHHLKKLGSEIQSNLPVEDFNLPDEDDDDYEDYDPDDYENYDEDDDVWHG